MGSAIRRDAIAIVLVALACGLRSCCRRSTSFMAGRSTRSPRCGGRCSARAAIRPRSPVAVIAIDEETYETPPFKGSPTLTWTTEIGRVLDAVIDGGAKVVGFDIVFPTSIELSEIPFGDDLLGGRMRGFDRDLPSIAREGGRRRQGGAGRSPARRRIDPAFAGTADRGRPAEEYPPAQYLFRPRRCGAPGAADVSGQRQAGTLDGARTGVARARRRTGAGRGRQRDARRLPDSGRGAEYADAEFRGRRQRCSRPFRSRTCVPVSKATTRISSAANSPARPSSSARCSISKTARSPPNALRPGSMDRGRRVARCRRAAAAGQFKRSSIAGVYIHATAVHNLMARDAVVEPGRLPTALIAIAFAALAGACGANAGAGRRRGCVISAWPRSGLGFATLAFARSLALPLSEPFLAGLPRWSRSSPIALS